MNDVHEITSGSRFLSPAGRIWTVRAVTPNGTRIELMSEEPDGEHGAVMDTVAILRMAPIDHPERGSAADVEHAETSLPELTRA